MAAGLLWILDASINISMEPFRAFVADLLPEEQRTQGFAMQSLFIGLGAVVASALPWLLTNAFHVAQRSFVQCHPVHHQAVVLPGRRRVLRSRALDDPLDARISACDSSSSNVPRRDNQLREILTAIREMPRTMRQLAPVQLLTWLGLFCMWLYFPVAVARNIFGAADQHAPSYTDGVEWAGVCFAMYSAVCFVFASFLPGLAKLVGRKWTHSSA